jgi:hypothetical protein
MIAVVLLSCDRLEYTRRTIATFTEKNAASLAAGAFKLWHCDDASTDPKVRKAAATAGFAPLVYTDQRVGVTEMVRRASRKLEHAGAEWMLLLENDWESARAVPLELFAVAVEAHDVWSFRLYGAFKERDCQRPAGTRHRGRGGADPKWRIQATPAEAYEVGHIHWGNPPAISRVDLVAWLHKKAKRERDAIGKSGEILQPVARVRENVVYHIGFSRTGGFVA